MIIFKRGAQGGHINDSGTSHGEDIPARLSPGGMLTNMTLIARVNGHEHELGTMTVDVPVHPSEGDPLFLEAGDIKPTLAAALREAADAIESDGEAN